MLAYLPLLPTLAYIRRGIEWRMARRQLGSNGMRHGGGTTISEEDTSRHAHRLGLSAAAGRRRRAHRHTILRMAAETLLGFLLTALFLYSTLLSTVSCSSPQLHV